MTTMSSTAPTSRSSSPPGPADPRLPLTGRSSREPLHSPPASAGGLFISRFPFGECALMRDTVPDATRAPVPADLRLGGGRGRRRTGSAGSVPAWRDRILPQRTSDTGLLGPDLLRNRVQRRADLLHRGVGCGMRGGREPGLPALRDDQRRQLLHAAQRPSVQRCRMLRCGVRGGPLLLPGDVGCHVRARGERALRRRQRLLRRPGRRFLHPAAPDPCM